MKSLIAPIVLITLTTSVTSQVMITSSHDWQNDPFPTQDVWADVATPESGRFFATGTTTVVNTDPVAFPQPLFSNITTAGPQPYVSGPRQVGVVRGTTSSGQVWQNYFYGISAPSSAGSTYCRAISVSVGADDLQTRVAICGETFEQNLPNSPTGPSPNVFESTGFIAVYDGLGTLLWSYQLWGRDNTASTIVTDISIFRDPTTQEDLITFCGSSTHGNYNPAPQQAFPLRPLLAFNAPSANGCGSYASGTTHNATPNSTSTQWDGFVGRVGASSTAPYSPTKRFHSIVGGAGTDELVALAPMDDTAGRYVVVGLIRTGNTGGGIFECPLTRPYYSNANSTPICPSTIGGGSTSRMGYAAVIDATPTMQSTLGNLVLESSTLIGNLGAVTEARDVIYHGGRIIIVGATTDTALLSAIGTSGWQNSINGSWQGFILTSTDLATGFQQGSFFSTGAEAECVGVSAWPDYPDHFVVSGWMQRSTQPPPASKKIELASVFVDTTSQSELVLVRQGVLSGTSVGEETPGAREINFTTGWNQVLVGIPTVATAGGGLSVDERGRVTVVGQTNGALDWPVVGTGSLGPQASHGADADAIRASVDMLPYGVGRTDGTGLLNSTGAWQPAAGFTGGTTSSCGAVTTKRIFVDYLGFAPAPNVAAEILVDRPPDQAAASGGILQFGFPGVQQSPTAFPQTPCPTGSSVYCPDFASPPGIESWANGSQPVTFTYIPPHQSLRQQLLPFPQASGQVFSVQFFSLMGAPCGNFEWTASPALIISY